jgi:hypothetical protein
MCQHKQWTINIPVTGYSTFRDRSISTLEKLLSIPYEAPLTANPPITPALLRLDPMFEPLRKDPRFQKLIASVAKSGSTSLAVRAAILMSPRIFLCRREQADPPFDLGRKHSGP